jgi:hypothetical protein
MLVVILRALWDVRGNQFRQRRSSCRASSAEQWTTTTACILSYGVLLSFNSDISQSIFHKSLVIFD